MKIGSFKVSVISCSEKKHSKNGKPYYTVKVVCDSPDFQYKQFSFVYWADEPPTEILNAVLYMDIEHGYSLNLRLFK